MRSLRYSVLLMLLAPAIGHAQEITVVDAKKALSAAKTELEKDVIFHPQDRGGGAFLKSEYDRRFELQQLENKAVRLGDTKENAAKYDVANRLETFKEKYKEEAFKAFIAYVTFVKVCRQYETLIKQDAPFQEKVDRMIAEMDELIDRHAPSLTLDSLKLLYATDSKGKVGAFKLPSAGRTVTIKGEAVDVIELRTLKDRVVLLNMKAAKQRKNYLLAEIAGQETYQTDNGEKLTGFLLQAYQGGMAHEKIEPAIKWIDRGFFRQGHSGTGWRGPVT